MTGPSAGDPRSSRAGRFVLLAIVVVGLGFAVVVGLGRIRPASRSGDPSADSDITSLESDSALERSSKSGEGGGDVSISRDSANRVSGASGDEIDLAEASYEKARIRYQEARGSVADAQAAMLKSERDVEELERFIEELEARGEDPVDHAEEGMERFMPAFEAYEIAIDRLEGAEEEEAIARMEFLGAEQRLKAARRRSDSLR